MSEQSSHTVAAFIGIFSILLATSAALVDILILN